MEVILKRHEEHVLRGRKDKRQNNLIQTLVRTKRDNPNIGIKELHYIALGYKEGQR